MKLKCITFSGANEYTKLSDLEDVLVLHTEAGIQVSGKKASFGTARYWWLHALHARFGLLYSPHPNFALHLNQDWVEDFCDDNPPAELSTFLSWGAKYRRPFFERVQLNFRIGREKTPDLDRMLASMKKYPNVRFILSYNDDNAEFINKLYDTGFKFDCLYDNSHGEGVEASQYAPPAFDGVLQGYAGGIGPDNVTSVLNKISQSLSAGRSYVDATGKLTSISRQQEIFIDAEGKLKGEDGHFSVEKCKAYLSAVFRLENTVFKFTNLKFD
ncbi:MAG: hypothetical protein J6J35_05620 [Alphaproteobacteria bacterium]|nr:hypothetical protein [Alphaproteobacteria bacterium]